MREDSNIENTISELQIAVREIKNKQFVASDSVIHYITQSDNDYDLHIDLDSAEKTYTLTADFDNATNGCVLRLDQFYAINQTDVLNSAVEPTAVTPQVSVDYAITMPQEDTRQQYTLIVTNNSMPTTYDVYLKFVFSGTDSVTFMTEEI